MRRLTSISKFSILFLSIIFYNSCSTNNNENNTSQTFLEKYNNIILENDEAIGEQFIRFNNDFSIAMEMLYLENIQNNCFEYLVFDFTNPNNLESFNITENTENKFEYKTVYADSIGGFSYTSFKVIDDTFVLEVKSFNNEGELLSLITDHYIRASVNIDNLIVCD